MKQNYMKLYEVNKNILPLLNSQGTLSILFFFSLAQKQILHSESVNLRYMPLILYARIVFQVASLNIAQVLTLKLGNIGEQITEKS